MSARAAVGLGLVALGLAAAGCKDRAAKAAPPPGEPVQGADVAKLPPADQARFEHLVDSLPSPCGKAESLRRSRNHDAACAVPARFAVDTVIALLGDGVPDETIAEIFAARAKDTAHHDFALGPDVPRAGREGARVELVEFFDYGCPACGMMYPVVEQMLAAYPDDLVVYYKEFPLPKHPASPGAAQAALAAGKQGRYLEMHALLFRDQEAHGKEQLDAYAAGLGLDLGQFEADYAAAAAQVAADVAEGTGVGVTSTPAIFLNGRRWSGPTLAKYLKIGIDEQLALNP